MKCCRKCPHRGPLSDFGKSTKTADGHDYLCRACRRETVQHNRHGGLMSAYREDAYPTRGDHRSARPSRTANHTLNGASYSQDH